LGSGAGRPPHDKLSHDEELGLDEKYARLAALHDEICTGEAKLGPASAQATEQDAEALTFTDRAEGLVWVALRDEARKLGENDRQHVENWLEDVRADMDAPPGTSGGEEVTQLTLDDLEPADQKAYLAFQCAESKAGKKLEDREAHDLLKEEGIPDRAGDKGKLIDYRLPSFDTWAKQLRNARKALGEQKYKRRGRARIGRSIVAGDQIETQHDES
jgi:hypothetical protein